VAETISRAFLHLTPAYPTRTCLHSCDICYATETDDILAASGLEASIAADLRPMFTDSRDGIIVCLRCAEAGDYLEIETEEVSP
jgi:hypothetical protein